MPQILLVRHGQSANNASPESQRVCDPGLTAVGVRQAEETSKRLAGLSIASVYCSPFLRALETTRPIAERLSIQPIVRSDIFEQGGCYSGYEATGKRGEPGMGRFELRERYPGWQLDPQIADAGWWGRDFESEQAVQARAEKVARWLIGCFADQDGIHALVIHADFKLLLINAIFKLQQQPELTLSEPLYNTGITSFSVHPKGLEMQYVNSVEHLRPELVTPQAAD